MDVRMFVNSNVRNAYIWVLCVSLGFRKIKNGESKKTKYYEKDI